MTYSVARGWQLKFCGRKETTAQWASPEIYAGRYLLTARESFAAARRHYVGL